MNVVEFRNVSKSYRRQIDRQFLRAYLTQLVRERKSERFYALRDVSFKLERGTSVGIMGHNGAGKSTMLSLIAGLTQPDSGYIKVNGRIAALLELGSGFHPELTGAENVRINASLLGLNARETKRRFDEIVEFAEMSNFIHEPLRTYSTGMVMRLAFAVAVNVDADLILVDEVLAVGDQRFQQKSFARVRQLKNEGKMLICVSHASNQLEQLCDHGLWLSGGKLVEQGPIHRVLADYQAAMKTTSTATLTASGA